MRTKPTSPNTEPAHTIMPNILDRRTFLATTAATTASVLSGNLTADDQAATKKTQHELCVFTKPFNSLSFSELADRIAEMGFDGIEAPIRKGGHIETEAIADELPKLVEALAERNLNITLVTSDINDPDDRITSKFLRTLGTLGLKRYRMKYLKYDLDLPIGNQLTEWNARLKQLAAMNHEYGVQGLYQNHAGTAYFGASVWDLAQGLDGINPDDLGVAYDIRHAKVEGANSWPIAFNMIKPLIGMIYVKDFDWDGTKVKNVPLGKGHVPAKFFSMLADTGFAGPISLHEEYLSHKDPKLVPQHLAAIKRDLAVLREMLKS